eukprot:CAMPEP_0184013144 /NCGR_PEP_ID=MMETSP0954-20121128/4844_1 /TAXON_ID=627963 /ORGANISM="Aplanochytrium sp, Strain PBS07" /LENGTH=342 /DNA_ID=CAMNT_0026293289 /DNA_START=357 /DNA_END=1385 /DNA_ORIENTATION=-
MIEEGLINASTVGLKVENVSQEANDLEICKEVEVHVENSKPSSFGLAESGRSRLLIFVAVLTVITFRSLHMLKQHAAVLQNGSLSSQNSWVAGGIVWSAGWVTAVSTGLGALPFFFLPRVDKQWLGISNGVAAGMMISASLGLLIQAFFDVEGVTQLQVSAGILSGFWGGVGFMKMSEIYFDDVDHEEMLTLKYYDAQKICLMMAAMTLHSFSEGVAIGVSFHSQSLGTFITTTLAIHNIPEGLALSIVLIPRGMSRLATVVWCICSSIPQPLMAVPAYFFVDYFRAIVPVGLGFAAGAMGYVAIFELYIESRETLSYWLALLVMVCSAVFMAGIQALIAYL